MGYYDSRTKSITLSYIYLFIMNCSVIFNEELRIHKGRNKKIKNYFEVWLGIQFIFTFELFPERLEK